MDKVHKGGMTFYIIVGIMILTVVAFLYSCLNNYAFSSLVRDTAKKDIVELEAKGIIAYNTYVISTDTIQKKSNFGILDDIYNQQKKNTSSLLDILSKTDNIIGASELTFFFTFIVAILSVFFGYKTIEVDKIVKVYEKKIIDVNNQTKDLEKKAEDLEKKAKASEENAKEYEKKTKENEGKASEYAKIVGSISKYNSLLTRVESIYNLSIIIGNMSMSLSPNKDDSENKSVLEEIGSLCSRLSRFCNQIESRLNNSKYRLNSMTNVENELINTYLDDTIGELRYIVLSQRLNKMTKLHSLQQASLGQERSKPSSLKTHLDNIIIKITYKVENIKKELNNVIIIEESKPNEI